MVDETMGANEYIGLIVFAKSFDELPNAQVGDVIRCHRLWIQKFENSPYRVQAVGTRSTSN